MDRFDRKSIEAASPRWVHACTARFQDVDAGGVVFFGRILEYFHDAYVAFLLEHGISLPEVLETHAWIAPLRRAESFFLAPIRFGDRIDVGFVGARWDRSVLFLAHRITTSDGRVAAVGITEHVFIDYKTRRPVPPPAAVLEAFRGLVAD